MRVYGGRDIDKWRGYISNHSKRIKDGYRLIERVK